MIHDFGFGEFDAIIHPFHSVLKLFTGFATAAFIAWKLIVIKVMSMADMPAAKNIHQLISILY